MRRPRYFLNTILGVVIAAGCSNAPSASEPETPNLSLQRTGLLFANCSNPARFDVSKSVGPEGGTVQMGPHTLEIPAGALSRTVTITAKNGPNASSKGNAIKFGPDGLRFNSYARLTVSTSNCTGLGLLNLPLIVYTDDLFSILELEPSLPRLFEKKVTGFITHFSQYAVAY